MDTAQYKKFLADYENYVRTVLIPTNEEVRELFSHWRDPGHWALTPRLGRLPSPSPIHRTHTRIKRPESVVDKILRQPSFFQGGPTIENVKKMHDAIGGRIVVYFLSHLPFIDSALRHSEEIEISSASPPIAFLNHDLFEQLGFTDIKRGHKDSGYASIHYTIRLRSSVVPLCDRPWFELQLRTLAEDVWGEIEHILGYKPDKKTSFAVRKQFQIISSELTAIDEHFNLLYEELSRFQQESIYRDESPLNAENLPAVLNELGIGCSQKEIDGLLKLLVSRKIETVGELRTEATPERVRIIQEVYRNSESRPPTHFELVASVAAIRSLADSPQIEDAVRSQIEFLNAWEKLKEDLTQHNVGVEPADTLKDAAPERC